MSKWSVEIRRITSVEEHGNAERLEIARVDSLDWDIVIGKGQFKVGDLAVYCPIETVLPDNIIQKLDQKIDINNGRIKAVRIRGVTSYGMLLDPGMMPILPNHPKGVWVPKHGVEVTETFGFKKYEPPEVFTTFGNRVKNREMNPLFHRYTDIENIRNYPNTFGWEVDGSVPDVYAEEKIHGTSARFGNLPKAPSSNWFVNQWRKVFGSYEFVVGSRNNQIDDSDHFYKKTMGVDVYTKIFHDLKFKSWLPKDTVVYGEIFGAGIQDLTYGLKEIRFYCYDVQVNGKYLSMDERNAFCDKYNLIYPALMYRGPWNQDVLKHATGLNCAGVPFVHIREGVVIRTVKELPNKLLGRTMVKAINPDYLIRKNGTEYH